MWQRPNDSCQQPRDLREHEIRVVSTPGSEAHGQGGTSHQRLPGEGHGGGRNHQMKAPKDISIRHFRHRQTDNSLQHDLLS